MFEALRLSSFARRCATLSLVVVGAGCSAEANADAVMPSTVQRDTATLDTAAVRRTGMTIVPADSAPWREQWTVPARLILDPAETQRLGAIAEGRVTRVLVTPGDRVRAGQVLVAVHSHEMLDAQSALAKAEASDAQAMTTLGVAESAAQRAERLHALKALSLSELERARASLADARSIRQVAAAELTRARALRDHLVGSGPVPAGIDDHEVLVRSPIDGVVVAREAQPGMVVLIGAPLVTVSRTTSLVLSASVPERALAAIAPGANVAFTVAGFRELRFGARVTRIAPTLDSVTRTVEVQARVRDTDAPRLRAEMYATAELLGPAEAATVGVPADAVQALEGDTVVVVARSHGASLTLEAVPVRVGRRTAERAEIVDGLAAGTRVVSTGAAIAKAEILRRRGT